MADQSAAVDTPQPPISLGHGVRRGGERGGEGDVRREHDGPEAVEVGAGDGWVVDDEDPGGVGAELLFEPV